MVIVEGVVVHGGCAGARGGGTAAAAAVAFAVSAILPSDGDNGRLIMMTEVLT